MKTEQVCGWMPVRVFASDRVQAGWGIVLLFVLAALTGCAGTQEHRKGMGLVAEGQYESGLSQLEEAVRLAPRNPEFRISLSNQRTSVVQRLLNQGDAALRAERFDEADMAYRRAAGIDDANAMARQGLTQVQLARSQRQRLAEAEALLKRGSENDLLEALEKLRPVLSASPSHRAALDLRGRIETAQSKLNSAEARLAAAFRRPITLDFRDAPLKAVFDVVSKVSGLNVYFDKEVRTDTRTSITIRNSSIEEAVRLLLTMNQLEQKVLNENSLLIYPSTAAKLKEHQTMVLRSFYLSNADPKVVMNTIKTIVKTKDITFDDRLGIIMMRDTAAAVRMAERIVALQDLTDPEVVLEVEVLEIKRARLLELGVKWPAQLTLSPLQADSSPLTLSGLRGLSSSTTQATIGNMVINARRDDQDGNVLANPRIRVRNREKAKVLIGDKVPVITTTAGAAGFVAESVAYVDVGLKLEVEPTIHLDDEVAIKVNLEVSNLVRELVSKSGTQSFQIGTRGASTVLRLRDGETQVLAGLISDEDRSTSNQVPLLGQLPVLGRLFGSQKDDSQRTEILLSITPRIVRAVNRPSLSEAEFESGTEGSIGVQSLRVRPASDAPASAVQVESVAVKGVQLAWSAPDQVKVGQTFKVGLMADSSLELRSLPLLLGYDPKVLEIVRVEAGNFFQEGGQGGVFTHRVDGDVGRVVASIGYPTPGGKKSGRGELLSITAKALAPAGEGTRLRLISVSPEPPVQTKPPLPSDHLVKVAE